MYIHNEISRQKMSIKQRMLTEVAKSIEMAYELCNIFSRFSVDMEVHADINTNPNFKSNDALKEAMGYIVGMLIVLGALLSKPNPMPSQAQAAQIK